MWDHKIFGDFGGGVDLGAPGTRRLICLVSTY